MQNGFVRYINSMNNANADTSNAIAETQVNNLYYQEIKVERRLGKQIVKDINEGKRNAYVITGHAGDGKTSILVQILDELGVLKSGRELKERDEIELAQGGKLIYVKDMSELPKEKQIHYMKEILEAPYDGNVGIIISNTGPLISTYKSVIKMQDIEYREEEVENFLLEQLDNNRDNQLENNNYKFYLINLARLDNVWFAPQFIEKISSDHLWTPCKACEQKERCPIYFNYISIKENKSSVLNFIEDYYRYLFERDKRMTIRQIVAHISYALTGNLECMHIKERYSNKYATYVYNFANQFFGYKGIYADKSALQIQSIKEIQALKLDKKALMQEYEIFVRDNFSSFSSQVKKVVERYWESAEARIIAHSHDEKDSKTIKNTERLQHRQSVRRFLIMYCYTQYENDTSLSIQLFGGIFEEYKEALFERLSRPRLRMFNKVIFNALFVNYVGVTPRDNEELFITLRREDKNQQQVLLVLGQARENELIIKQRPNSNKFEDSKYEDISTKYDIVLQMREEEYILDFPLLNYFYSIATGAVYGKINSELSHGLAKLNIKLLRAFKDEAEEAQFKILINEGDKRTVKKFEIIDKLLYID